LGLFVEHLVGAQKIKGLKTPFKSTQSPAKTTPNKQKTNGSQYKNGFVPKINKKNEKEWKNFEKWGFGKNGGKWKNGLMGGRRWVGTVENDQRWCLGGGGGDGWRWVGGFWILGRRVTEEREGGCTAG
jgi:hypothetical protein